jgi:hypothetical protein
MPRRATRLPPETDPEKKVVVTTRIPAWLYNDLFDEAAKRSTTIGEEAERTIRAAIDVDRLFGSKAVGAAQLLAQTFAMEARLSEKTGDTAAFNKRLRELVGDVLRLRFGAQLGPLLEFLGEGMLSTATDTATVKRMNVGRALLADRQVFKPAADFAATFLAGLIELVPGSNEPAEGAGNEGDEFPPGKQYAHDLLEGLAGKHPFDVMAQPVIALLDAATVGGAK